MNVLIACEFSGVVREAFRDKGHNAWSCDILPAEDGSDRHFQQDVLELLRETPDTWDLMIAHPPCTRLCNSGVRWLHERNLWDDLYAAAEFVEALGTQDIPNICIENPVMHKHAKRLIHGYRDPDQIIQPWQFGHPETKATCLWLKNLPRLVPTDVVEGRGNSIHMHPDNKERSKNRSRTFRGIAKAMAEQWG